MMISGWKKRYSDILKEFKYSEKKDKESAILLNSILKKSDVNEKIINLVKGKTVFVIGSGPSLSTAIPKLKNFKKSVKIIKSPHFVKYFVYKYCNKQTKPESSFSETLLTYMIIRVGHTYKTHNNRKYSH